MAKVCAITGKKPMYGNTVSHANNRSKRRFEPNLHTKRIWSPGENRFVTLKVSSRGLRTINKAGIDKVLADLRKKGGNQ
ncbi:MAG: 50S ribosomal protein L28 [Bryobacterales bacterium]|nr:50S ribosomal protein L28 [Bryobacterales bacterium]